MEAIRLVIDLHDFHNPLTNLILDSRSSDFKTENWSLYFIKPASPIMYGIIDLHDFIMVYLVFIVFFVTFMLFIILKESTISEFNEIQKFNKIKSIYNVKFNHHTQLETIWIVVPSIILLTIAIPSFIILYAMDIIPAHDFSIKVVGHQWYWSYEYIMKNLFSFDTVSEKKNNHKDYEHETLYRYSFDSYMIPSEDLKPSQQRLLETTNPLVIPIARYASVTVTSVDVIHSFAVPSLGIKIDAVPGRLNTVSMYIMELGHFYGQCSELCGVNHGFMPIEIYCVDLVGFSIYKAALASKIVTKEDLTSVYVDVVTRWKLLNAYSYEYWGKVIKSNKFKQLIKNTSFFKQEMENTKNLSLYSSLYSSELFVFNFYNNQTEYVKKLSDLKNSPFPIEKFLYFKRGPDIKFVDKFSCAIDIFIDEYFEREAEEDRRIAEELIKSNKL